MAQLNKVVEQRDFGANLAREIARADLRLKVSEYLMIWVGVHDRRAAAHDRAVGRASRPSATRSCCWSAPLVGFMLPRFWLGRRKSSRLKSFNKQLPDTITLIANALRAGSSFLQAIELVVRESRPPISTEFGRVIREVNLGLSFDVALENMVRRVRVGRPGADGHRHLHPAHRRWQPRRDPGLDRVHHPRARPDQGRDQDAHRPAAAVGLRRRLPADRPRRLPVHRRPAVHGPDVRRPRGAHGPAGRGPHPRARRLLDVHGLHVHPRASWTSRSRAWRT